MALRRPMKDVEMSGARRPDRVCAVFPRDALELLRDHAAALVEVDHHRLRPQRGAMSFHGAATRPVLNNSAPPPGGGRLKSAPLQAPAPETGRANAGRRVPKAAVSVLRIRWPSVWSSGLRRSMTGAGASPEI